MLTGEMFCYLSAPFQIRPKFKIFNVGKRTKKISSELVGNVFIVARFLEVT